MLLVYRVANVAVGRERLLPVALVRKHVEIEPERLDRCNRAGGLTIQSPLACRTRQRQGWNAMANHTFDSS